MDPKDLVRSGKLSEARQKLVEKVKSSPADIAGRTLLFQVLAFCGEWTKAERQLDAIASQDPKAETGVQVYKNLLKAEKERLEVMSLKVRPSFLPGPPEYCEAYFAALEKVNEGKHEEAAGLLSGVEAARPRISGMLNGGKFAGFRDTDAFLSLFFEAIVHDRYVWIPMDSVRELAIDAPTSLFDLLWIPCHLATWSGMSLGCYLPVLYPGSFRHEDERVRLGRLTDWEHLGGPYSRGRGQHVFETGGREVALLEIREMIFKSSVKAGKK